MSMIINDEKKDEEYQTIINNNNNNNNNNEIYNNRDIHQLHQNINESLETSKLRQRSRDNFEQSWPPYRKLLKFISQLTHIPSSVLNNYARTIYFLILLGMIFPFHLCITLFTIILSNLISYIPYKQSIPKSNPDSKRILISDGRMTKALQLCRSLHQAGHEIILIDESVNWLTGHRWSNSVERFYVHPSPLKEPDAYINTLANIVRKEKINIFIPITRPSNACIDTQVKSALAAHGCSTFRMDIDERDLIDNKYTFINKARSLGLTVPKSFLITSRYQLLDFDFDNKHCSYICQCLTYDRETKIKLPRTTSTETTEYINKLHITEECPYILQELIPGKEYCIHGTCIDGELTLFTCCYSSSNQLNYKHINRPVIFEWCTQYIRALKFTGHISVNFIVSDTDGKAYAIECNSCVHSAITTFYNHPNVADAYFLNKPSSPIVPLSTARETYWLIHELWFICRNIRSIKNLIQSLKRIFSGKEAIWSWNDPLPFLLHYHIHIVYLLFDNLFSKHTRFFNKIDCCIGELV